MTPVATVTLLADPHNPYETIIPSEVWNLPWSEHPRVDVEVQPNDSLASVLGRAHDQFGLPHPGEDWAVPDNFAFHNLLFFQPGDASGIPEPHLRVRYELNLVDSRGVATFGVHDYRTVTVQQLLKSADAGTLAGDPLRPYLLIEAPHGDAGPVDWATFKDALSIIWDIVESLGVVGGATWAWDAVRERLSAGRESLDEHWTDWAQRSHGPHQFTDLFDNRPWRASEIATLLDCPEEDAIALLKLFGYSAGEDGFWTRGTGSDAAAMRMILQQTDFAHRRDYGDWDIILRRRIEIYFQTGELPQDED